MRFCFLMATVLAAGFHAAIPAHAAGTCVRDLAHAENSLVKTLVRMRGAPPGGEERCSAYQGHAKTLGKAREVFARCKTGAERDTEVGQLDSVLNDANAVITKACRPN